ncbi:Rne/Rng family ribonuclease [Homoserinibacter sp. YIM 151385]|uniref:Rne/Rng family ribonuclease n=1 Tax=Homoserinibacter sp. YIM 151385 TaxID=2985506 RepID=UPI0022F0FBE4|nr:ribonuclease E/G [Homoserinibacter sp. YIM 151385]WBU38987.1 Rne/Rng family ribonuclease [Homoserinibacter sp. YIM 151385]
MVEEKKPGRRGILGGRRRKAAEQAAQQAAAQQDAAQQDAAQRDAAPAPETEATRGEAEQVAAPAAAELAERIAQPVPPVAPEPSSVPTAPAEQPAAEQPAAEHPAEGPSVAGEPAAAQPADVQPAADAPAAETDPEPPLVATSPRHLLFRAPDLPTWTPPAREARTPQERGGAAPQSAQAGSQPAGEEDGQSRRRTRRRGEREEGAAEQGGRQRQRQAPEPISEPQKIKGSTRLEAKKQRRRDGRDAGRRRPVITEAEFLARRESVDRQMVVREKSGRIQIAVLEDGVLVEHYVARSSESSLIGNVYLGRVQNVLPSMEAAFVDIGRGRNAVLYSGEVDWDAVQQDPEKKNQPRRIELALKPGDRVLVQVTKDPVGHKGARLTSQVSLPGRYLVYVPNGSMNGISRKLPDTERARLKKILKEVLPDDAGVIVRTAAEGATEEQLTLDVQRLTSQWAEIARAQEIGNAPALLHSEPDLLIKIVRDVFNEDFHKLVVAGDEVEGTIRRYLTSVAPDLLDRLESFSGERDAFDAFRVTEQIEKALDRKVWLPSGGSLIIDRTEAMTVVDVNTGKFVGSGGNLEETVTKNNLEAAEEVVRQLRLRDIGGIIVVDFIDMVLESNRDLVLRRLVECLSRDRTKHQVAEVTSLGLIQMTRKKLGLGLLESFSETCEVCAGRGLIVHHDPVSKHRPQQQGGGNGGEGGGRRRGGRGNGNGGGNGGSNGQPSQPTTQGAGSNGTHAITEDVRNALAQIAKSTVPHVPEGEGAEPAAGAEGGSAAEATATASTSEAETGSGAGAQAPAAAEPPATVERAAEAAAEAAVDILDLSSAKKAKGRQRRISTHDAELILDSVLEALPEPKEAGAGRQRRSRRASTSGAVITPGAEPGAGER